ncbi:hypothetical protein OIU84_020413 [Salix udensis]|uniref:Nudix hydrolase domain-containing protein n=1 Tax=Salix udensis TaxID=889485 RepID=A0AAD6PGZ2_9ROSI|nr:hypothetical protein OIU84_020413 [Salix udensis]
MKTRKVAAIRELKEETEVTSAEVLAEAPSWLTYDFPPEKVEHPTLTSPSRISGFPMDARRLNSICWQWPTLIKKNDSQFQSLGMCQRLFQFFMNNLIARPFKSITLRHADAEPRSYAAVPVDEQAPLILKSTIGEEKLHHQGPRRSEDTGSGSEIKVHFKQTEEELEYWTSVDKLGSSVHEPIKDSPRITGGDHPRLKKGGSTPIPLSAKGQIP